MIQEIGRFQAADDTGTVYTIIHYQHYRQFRPVSGQAQQVPTLQAFKTSTGLDVNLVDRDAGTYKIVSTDEVVRQLR